MRERASHTSNSSVACHHVVVSRVSIIYERRWRGTDTPTIQYHRRGDTVKDPFSLESGASIFSYWLCYQTLSDSSITDLDSAKLPFCARRTCMSPESMEGAPRAFLESAAATTHAAGCLKTEYSTPWHSLSRLCIFQAVPNRLESLFHPTKSLGQGNR